MDLAFRYPAVIQVMDRNGHEVFFGYSPDFGIEIYEVVDPGNLSQEYMFHLKLRRLIGERIAVQKAEEKELPPIQSSSSLGYRAFGFGAGANSPSHSQMVSTSEASRLLNLHPDTIRALFDSGVLKGTLTQGGKRMILMSSIHEEEARLVHRAEMRKLEQRIKRKNQSRKAKRARKQNEEKARLLEEILIHKDPI